MELCVYAGHADTVHVCLFDAGDREGASERRIPLTERAHGFWFGHLRGVTPGQRYAVRASGPWQPENGLRYNESKLLLDPYARAIEGDIRLAPSVFGHQVGVELAGDTGLRDDRDSKAYVPRCVVVDEAFDWEGDVSPHRSLAETVIYEVHVKNLTERLPGIPDHLRGTYAGLAHPVTIEHLTRLGITAVELLPVQAFTTEPEVLRRGLTNHWGYNTLGFFAPHAAYASAQDPQGVLDEFKGMVKLLHRAGIEVLLDVVYNHTSEQSATGMTLSWRGLDNRAYYRLDDRGHDIDVTGCGNTLDLRHPVVCRMVLDSLRYWVEECHVDGFRFDLGVALARGRYDDYDPNHPFLVALRTDPVLSRVKNIAEPWDLGIHGWRTGQFPPPFSEWNDRFRDGVRSFWLAGLGRDRESQAGPRRAGPRHPAGRVAGPLRHPRPRADRVGQLRRRPRRVHRSRPHDVRRQAQRREPRGQPRRHRQQPVLEPRRRGPDRRRGRPGGPTAVDPQPARHAADLHRRADAQRRRRVRAQPGRQQQRVLPGQRRRPGSTGTSRRGSRTCSRRRATSCG